ncbi:MAG: putative membrane protein YdjX (TVP38/TMEM64 family) [Candidatus Latescibacterota bacterium]|jgi:uncharacterized membrane protein YdjX (TVP38/TMEM64 family)
MRALIKIALALAGIFTLTFVVIRLSGVLDIVQIKAWLLAAQEWSPWVVGGIVIVLLWVDIVIAVPTLAVAISAGYFLGFAHGALATFTGLVLSGMSGYGLGHVLGEKALRFAVRDTQQRDEAMLLFQQRGLVMIVLSRAVPILPEISSCLAGITRMSLIRFVLAWLASIVPYTLVATYAGSISTVEDPTPAIYATIALSLCLWLSWYLFHRSNKSP